jgi:peptidoglycan/xylan/chitin deacetylase (PgdA/CDA1 family)
VGLSRKKLLEELKTSAEIIEDNLGAKVSYLSLPFGRYDEPVIATAKDVGYEAICSLNPDNGESSFVKGRYGVYWLDSISTLRNKLGWGKNVLFEKWKLKNINRFSNCTVLVKKLRNLPDFDFMGKN